MAIQREISLENAVQKSCTKRFSTWFTSGNILDNDLVKNAFVSRIGISWSAKKPNYSLTLATHSPESQIVIHNLGNFSSLEELKKIHPQVFEVTGTLDAH